MVAVINSSRRLQKILQYNEKKLESGVATCLAAVGYPKESPALNFHQKLARLQNLADLNKRTKVHAIHISLNFHPSETHSEEKLKAIAADYMQRIGFGGQPYLLYEHTDAGHPHLHLVTTNVRENGHSINLHNIGKIQSEKARRETEIAFGLVKADDHPRKEQYRQSEANAEAAKFGKGPTKREIIKALNYVLPTYTYANLPELNAILKQFNVMADRGGEDSRIYKHGGLTFAILKKDGSKAGEPIKASDLNVRRSSTEYGSPTLTYLEECFRYNGPLKKKNKKAITDLKNAIDLTLLGPKKKTVAELAAALKVQGIDLVLRKNKEGFVYGITYVHHGSKSVYNGSDLSNTKAYGAKGILNRCAEEAPLRPEKQQAGMVNDQERSLTNQHRDAGDVLPYPMDEQPTDERELLDLLMQPEYTSDYLPYHLRPKRRRKKRRKG